MIEVAKDPRFGNTKALLLFENPEDVLKVVEGGVEIPSKRWFNGSLCWKSRCKQSIINGSRRR